MKPFVRASFVAISALLVLLMLAPGAALANSASNQSGLKVDWHRAQVTGLGRPEESFAAGAYANGTYVVSSFGNVGGRIWASPDGLDWSLAWRGQSPPFSIVPGGPGFVAWSSGILLSKNGYKWTSANEGVPERLLNSPFTQLGSVAGTVVAFADTGRGYWSADGHNWNEIQGPSPRRPITLAGDGMHLWALTGGRDFDTQTESPVEVWVTDDGQTWTNSAQLPNSHRVSGLSAAFGPRGGVVIAGAKAWFSADDVHWHVATNTPTLTKQGPDSVKAVVADASGFIVAAEREQPGCAIDPAQGHWLTWTSVDGDVWRNLSGKGLLHREIDELFITGRTLLAVGVVWTHEQPSGAVWRAQLPNLATDNAPPPSPLPAPGRQGC